MRARMLLSAGGIVVAGAAAITAWIASPLTSELVLPPPLEAWADSTPSMVREHDRDLLPLTRSFQPQVYRSFCGPASLSTVLRAFGAKVTDQTDIFPSLRSKLDAFYTGMSLRELARLADSTGLSSEIVYADTVDLNTFRERLRANLQREGDFVLVNYDRRVLKQAGAGHISPLAAYDGVRDAFLILDEAAYRYPFTWVPTKLLYEAVRTIDGNHYRGILLISAYRRPND